MLPFELEKTPVPGQNRPASGTYGEQADLDRLRQSLPSPQGQPPAGPQGPPGTPLNPPVQAGPPPGVPAPIMAPSDRPQVPLGTPLVNTGQPVLVPESPSQARMAFLHALVQSPETSEVTKRWAEAVLEAYGG